MADHAPTRQATNERNEQMKKCFDGYNTVVRYRARNGIELVRYVRDEMYGGDDNVFSVRLLSTAEDIEDFKTHAEAVAFWKKCENIIRKNGYRNLIKTLYPNL